MIRNITELNLLEGAKIVAGEKGINNEILWVNLMEILDALDSLQRGELLITTGYEIDNEDQFRDLIPKLKKRGLCGIVIQTGYYIDEIPEYIKESGDNYDFPVIELPPNLTFSTIMHVLIENINTQSNIHDNSDVVNLRNKLNNILNSGYNNYINRMIENREESKVYLLLMSVYYENPAVTNDVILKSINRVKEYLISVSTEVEIEWFGEEILFIISLKKEVTFQDISFNISKILNNLSQEFQMKLFIGANILTNTDNLISTFNDCIASQQMLEKIGAKRGICSFEDIEIIKLLESMRNNDYAIDFSYKILKPIEEYDNSHKSYYLDTLKLYLMNECNISDTSTKLFIHRHTLKNRLNKISQLSKIDFKSYYSRMKFSIALFIHDYFM